MSPLDPTCGYTARTVTRPYRRQYKHTAAPCRSNVHHFRFSLSQAGASAFADTCTKILGKMINTVPKGVTLSEPIVPNVVKPVNITLSLTSDGGLQFAGAIRVCRANPDITA